MLSLFRVMLFIFLVFSMDAESYWMGRHAANEPAILVFPKHFLGLSSARSVILWRLAGSSLRIAAGGAKIAVQSRIALVRIQGAPLSPSLPYCPSVHPWFHVFTTLDSQYLKTEPYPSAAWCSTRT